MSPSPSEAFRHNTESYESLYRGEPAFPGALPPDGIPWDIRQAQPRLMELKALGAIGGEVLDAGCSPRPSGGSTASRSWPERDDLPFAASGWHRNGPAKTVTTAPDERYANRLLEY